MTLTPLRLYLLGRLDAGCALRVSGPGGLRLFSESGTAVRGVQVRTVDPMLSAGLLSERGDRLVLTDAGRTARRARLVVATGSADGASSRSAARGITPAQRQVLADMAGGWLLEYYPSLEIYDLVSYQAGQARAVTPSARALRLRGLIEEAPGDSRAGTVRMQLSDAGREALGHG